MYRNDTTERETTVKANTKVNPKATGSEIGKKGCGTGGGLPYCRGEGGMKEEGGRWR